MDQADHQRARGERARAELATVATGSWEQMAPRLGLRLELAGPELPGPRQAGSERAGSERADPGRLGLTLGPGIRAGVVADFTHAMLPVDAGHAAAWARTPAEVVALARANTGAAPRLLRRSALPAGAPDRGQRAEPIELVLVAGTWFTTGLAADLGTVLPGGPPGWALLVAPAPTTLVVATAPGAPAPLRARALAHRLGPLAGHAGAVFRCNPGGNMDIVTIFR